MKDILQFLQWLFALFIRVVIWGILLALFPFRLLRVTLEGAASLLLAVEDDFIVPITRDLRNCCPWPWLPEIRKRLDEASEQERLRMLRNLSKRKEIE